MELFQVNITKCLLDQCIKNVLSREDIFDTIRYYKSPSAKLLPQGRGRIVISNHSSFFDLTIVRKHIQCYCVANFSSIYTNNITDEQFLNDYHIIIYDYSLESGTSVKAKILELINSGHDVLVFPEGYSIKESSRDLCLLKDFKKGLFHLAYENDISIIPISQWHYGNINPSYFDCYTLNVISNLPICTMNVDVIIDHEISPKSFSSFDEFYICCFETVRKNLIKLKNI